MFEGEKTFVFWIGLIILGLASVALFTLIWFNAVSVMKGHSFYAPTIELQVPLFVAAIIFLLIALYMMKFGVEEKQK